MPGWALAVIYAAGFVITARIMFMTRDSGDRAEDRFASVCVGLIWPLALAVFIICGLAALPTLGAKTGRERREQAVTAARERHNLAVRAAARTAELEAENERLRKAAGELCPCPT
jgi:Na+/proline symporter